MIYKNLAIHPEDCLNVISDNGEREIGITEFLECTYINERVFAKGSKNILVRSRNIYISRTELPKLIKALISLYKKNK